MLKKKNIKWYAIGVAIKDEFINNSSKTAKILIHYLEKYSYYGTSGIMMSQSEIAEKSGVGLRSVKRAMSEMRKANMVGYCNKSGAWHLNPAYCFAGSDKDKKMMGQKYIKNFGHLVVKFEGGGLQ